MAQFQVKISMLDGGREVASDVVLESDDQDEAIDEFESRADSAFDDAVEQGYEYDGDDEDDEDEDDDGDSGDGFDTDPDYEE